MSTPSAESIKMKELLRRHEHTKTALGHPQTLSPKTVDQDETFQLSDLNTARYHEDRPRPKSHEEISNDYSVINSSATDFRPSKYLNQGSKLDLRDTSEYRSMDIQSHLSRGIHSEMNLEDYKRLVQDSDASVDTTTSGSETLHVAQERCRKLKCKLQERRQRFNQLRGEFRSLLKSIETSQLDHFKLETLLRKFIAEEEVKIAQLHEQLDQKNQSLEKEKRKTQHLLHQLRKESRHNAKLCHMIQNQNQNQNQNQSQNQKNGSTLPKTRGDLSPSLVPVSLAWSSSAHQDSGPSSFSSRFRSSLDSPSSSPHSPSWKHSMHKPRPRSPWASSNLSSTVLSSRFHDTLQALPPQNAAEIVTEISNVLERLLVDESFSSAHPDAQMKHRGNATESVCGANKKSTCVHYGTPYRHHHKKELHHSASPNNGMLHDPIQDTDLWPTVHRCHRDPTPKNAFVHLRHTAPSASYKTDYPCGRRTCYNEFYEPIEKPKNTTHHDLERCKTESQQLSCTKQDPRDPRHCGKPSRYRPQNLSPKETIPHYPPILTSGRTFLSRC